MTELPHQHEVYKYEEFWNGSRIGWDPAQKQAMCKRLYLYQQIIKRASHQRGERCLKRAAREMDVERGDLFLDKYLQHLKANDKGTRKRKRIT